MKKQVMKNVVVVTVLLGIGWLIETNFKPTGSTITAEANQDKTKASITYNQECKVYHISGSKPFASYSLEQKFLAIKEINNNETIIAQK